MKRYGILSIAVLAVLGFLFFRERGTSLNQVKKNTKAPVSSTSISQPGFKEQASSTTSASKVSSREVALFQGDGGKAHIDQNTRPLRATGLTPLPASSETLRSTALWPDLVWQVWTGVKAVELKNLQNASGKQLGRLGSYMIVEDGGQVVDEHQFSSAAPIPVYNHDRNKAGLITGVFTVVLQDAQDFQSFILDYDLRVVEAMPSLRVYYVMLNKEPYDLVAAFEGLKKDARVEKVDLEVVTQSYVKN